MQTNHRLGFQSCDNNIMKKKLMVWKHTKNNKINNTLHSNFKYLETIKMDKTYMKFGVNGTVLVILKTGKLEAFGLTPVLTPGCMPPSSEFVFSDNSSPRFLSTFQETTIIIIFIRRRNHSNIQFVSLLHESRERKVIVFESSHDENYYKAIEIIHPTTTRFN